MWGISYNKNIHKQDSKESFSLESSLESWLMKIYKYHTKQINTKKQIKKLRTKLYQINKNASNQNFIWQLKSIFGQFIFTSFFFFEKQILIVCSLFLLSLTSQALTGFPDTFTLCIKAFSSMVWQSIRGMLPWCQLKKPSTYIFVLGIIIGIWFNWTVSITIS